MAKYKIIFDKEKCIGCRTCEAVCPEVFELKDDNKANIKKSETDKDCVKDAKESCPTKAIKITKIED